MNKLYNFLFSYSLNLSVNVERSQRPRAPLQGQLLRHLQDDGENIFEPSQQRDYDDEAPLEPPRNLLDMARLAADRVATRLELMEMSPALRQLRDKNLELNERLDRLNQRLEDVVRRLMSLERANAAAVSSNVELEERYRRELRRATGRIRSECLQCLVVVTLVVGLFVSVYFKF